MSPLPSILETHANEFKIVRNIGRTNMSWFIYGTKKPKINGIWGSERNIFHALID